MVMICQRCGEEKPKDLFVKQGESFMMRCKSCQVAMSMAWASRNKDRIKARAKDRRSKNEQQLGVELQTRKEKYEKLKHRSWIRSLLINFGVSESWYNNKRKEQGYKCKICGITEDDNKRKLAIDHNHADGEIRGLLCLRCNLMLGYALDNPKTLISAANYILQGQDS